jgi:hypothetical protein
VLSASLRAQKYLEPYGVAVLLITRQALRQKGEKEARHLKSKQGFTRHSDFALINKPELS